MKIQVQKVEYGDQLGTIQLIRIQPGRALASVGRGAAVGGGVVWSCREERPPLVSICVTGSMTNMINLGSMGFNTNYASITSR